ncbi:hypothetical protein ACNPQK_04330 [Acinetobacter guillouiae]|uniref:hypothetical protein n=1 Tax=Acinetobacter guillouiae TaxID=106649 RepID=UPI002656B7BB|nr:hypothetical protein [Acinetobacter sp.]MDN5623625.1 hypothetical protein [Acinetobacter sp.]MDN5647909.1 hypothetical protein [Acinetobacter sp.]MDN5689845.1 hypothetical protein [Acinetobacter sp.]
MLLYVIPFVLLLVVAIVLKKREDANKENASANNKKSNNKKTSKKNVARTARTSKKQQTTVVEDEVIVKQATKPLSPELKSNIEKLIAEKNYFSAEAKINQVLNQDNAQHELYLYLLDVHLAQKDEFAVNQLINHIRSLGLDEIVIQAEERRKANQADHPVESIAFEPSSPVVPESKNTAAFDALIGNTETISQPAVSKTETQNLAQVDALEFDHATLVEQKVETPQQPVQPLEFNLDPAPEKAPTTPELSFEAAPPAPEIKTETVQPLEFTFTANEPAAVPVEKAAEVEIAPEFKLDFAEPITPAATEESTPVRDFEFKLTPTEPETQPTFSFDLDPKPETVEQALSTETLSLETPSEAETSLAIDANDPLLHSFPELAQVNEVQLNLDLAQQYLNLGAYASVRELLSQNEAAYTAEQCQQSQNLLNQIAS